MRYPDHVYSSFIWEENVDFYSKTLLLAGASLVSWKTRSERPPGRIPLLHALS